VICGLANGVLGVCGERSTGDDASAFDVESASAADDELVLNGRMMRNTVAAANRERPVQ
jgi:hypothetical protein